MVSLIVTTLPGLTAAVKREAEAFGIRLTDIDEAVLQGEASLQAYVTYAYHARTITQVFPLLARVSKDFTLQDVNDDILRLVREAGRVRITRVHGLKAYEQDLGRLIVRELSLTADVKQPAVHLGYAVYADGFLIGPLLHPFNLCKRHYRLYTVPNTPSSCLAAAMLILAGVQDDEHAADLMGYDGTFILEYAGIARHEAVRHDARETVSSAYARLLPKPLLKDPEAREARFSLFYADKNPNHVYRARQNARLADIEKQVTFTKLGLDWLELRLPEAYFTLLMGRLPGPSQRLKEAYYARILTDYFRLAAYALREQGRIILLTTESTILTRQAEEAGFIRTFHQPIQRGDATWHMSLLTRA